MGFRLIASEPRLARILEQINLGILPEDVRDWAIGWVRDVGTLLRSREMMVGFVASLVYYFGLLAAVRYLEKLLGLRVLDHLERLLR